MESIAWMPEITETSCSTLFPPKIMATLVFIILLLKLSHMIRPNLI
jgi:hypothetical protein